MPPPVSLRRQYRCKRTATAARRFRSTTVHFTLQYTDPVLDGRVWQVKGVVELQGWERGVSYIPRLCTYGDAVDLPYTDSDGPILRIFF